MILGCKSAGKSACSCKPSGMFSLLSFAIPFAASYGGGGDGESGWLQVTVPLKLQLFGGGGLVSKSCLTTATPWTAAASLLYPWDSPGKNTGVGCRFLLQGTFPTQESNPGLLHCRQILCRQSYERSHTAFWGPGAMRTNLLLNIPTWMDPRDFCPPIELA